MELLEPETRRWVHQVVKQYLPPSYDREFIASGIIIEAWRKGVENISRLHIRNKCIDEWRKRERERKGKEKIKEWVELETPSHTKIVEREILVSEVRAGTLTSEERKLVYLRYWEGFTLEEIATFTSSRKDEVFYALEAALFKMRSML